ncbi:hypothetical protein CEP53_013265 [Fusarium sp. AF-6]|nr:hypothetical protein CEP53_013265 [Fusarium sp. AF-6]
MEAHSPQPQSQLRTPASHRAYCICCCLLHLCIVPIRPQPVLAALVAVIDSGTRATLSRSICSPQRPAAPKRAAFTARSPLSSSTRDPRSQPAAEACAAPSIGSSLEISASCLATFHEIIAVLDAGNNCDRIASHLPEPTRIQITKAAPVNRRQSAPSFRELAHFALDAVAWSF